jgi:glycine betaine/proline transport system ATP-binding protein
MAQTALIECRNVWKIFGDRAREAIEAIRAKGLSKRDVLAQFNCVVGVHDASFTVQKGEIFCIMGLSGSGKSTLIRLLNRLIDPSLGEVLVKGRAINGLAMPDLRARTIGMVFQNVALIPTRTVQKNAAFGLEVQGVAPAERRRIATDALTRVGLADWLHRYPRELSGGMQQRVGLARALAADPEIILMDEPFSALDPLIRRQLQDEFGQLTKSLGKSAVFITHDLDEAIRIGDRIAIMKDGAMVQTGTAEQIVMAPADQYVADFVAGISRIHLVKAASVMMPVADFRDAPMSELARTGLEADIDALIHLVLASPHQAVAVAEGDALCGVVTARTLLEGLKGDSAPAPQGT